MLEGFGCKLAGILTCTGARGWKQWGWRLKGWEAGPGRRRGGGELRGGNGWAGARDNSGLKLRHHVDVVQESGEAGTGVDASCGETRAAEEEPVVENGFLFDQLTDRNEGTAHKERVGQIGRVRKERIGVCRPVQRNTWPNGGQQRWCWTDQCDWGWDACRSRVWDGCICCISK